MTSGEVLYYVGVNAGAWLTVHLGFAWAGTRLPAHCFDRDAFLFRERRIEAGGRLYVRLFRVKKWKDISPDGASWFKGGFPKRRLGATDTAYLQRFVTETRRGEAVHWAVMCASILFILWNPPNIAWCMVVYGIAANLPFIVIQRYNRIRLRRVLARR